MPFAIDFATSEDEQSIAGLMLEFDRHFGVVHLDIDGAIEALKNLLQLPECGQVWVLRAEGEIVGYMAVTFGYSLEFCGRIAWYDELFVLEAFRGKGIGTLAIETGRRFCKELGFKALMLELDKTNLEAGKLYDRLGFKPRDKYTTLVADL